MTAAIYTSQQSPCGEVKAMSQSEHDCWFPGIKIT